MPDDLSSIRHQPSLPDTGDCCPECGSCQIETVPGEHTFLYGVGDEAEKISVVLPFRHCRNCDFRFLDDEGEEAMHEAVCRHLGVMTPADIRRLREQYGLSRQEFARLSRLGEATIARWERGALIQNAAHDQLLYLLTFPDNVQRLQARMATAGLPAERTKANGQEQLASDGRQPAEKRTAG